VLAPDNRVGRDPKVLIRKVRDLLGQTAMV
jgi:hypothetical protein